MIRLTPLLLMAPACEASEGLRPISINSIAYSYSASPKLISVTYGRTEDPMNLMETREECLFPLTYVSHPIQN